MFENASEKSEALHGFLPPLGHCCCCGCVVLRARGSLSVLTFFHHSKQRRLQRGHSQTLLGKSGDQFSVLFMHYQSKVQGVDVGSGWPWPEGVHRMSQPCLGSCWVSLNKLGPFPACFPKTHYPFNSVCANHTNIESAKVI